MSLSSGTVRCQECSAVMHHLASEQMKQDAHWQGARDAMSSCARHGKTACKASMYSFNKTCNCRYLFDGFPAG